MSERRYPISYKVDPRANATKAELEARGDGGCDALLLLSVIFRENGWRTQEVSSVDGRTGGALPPKEWFKSWVMMAHGLMNQPDLSPGQRELCAMVFEAVRQTMVPGPGTRKGD